MDARSEAIGGEARLQRAITEVEVLARELDIQGRVERHPYAMVALAAGVGFVMGGGLFRPFAGRLFRSGLQLAILPLAERLVLRLLSGKGGDVPGGTRMGP